MDNNNSVAFVGKIHMINNIPGCDNIQHARINDWGTIVKKDAYKIGDLVGVAIVDAILPEEMVERLNIKSYLRKGNRVRTVKLKGVYSECLVFDIDENYKEGQDLMTDFNIVKYEEPVKMISLPNGSKFKYKENENFHIYYKFPNYKNVPEIFNEDDNVVITRKYHGCNARYGIVKKNKLSFWDKIKDLFKKDNYRQYDFIYGSHRCEKGSDSQGFYSTDVWREIGSKYDLRMKVQQLSTIFTKEEVGTGVILYGEIIGPGIQGGDYDYGLKKLDFKAFDIELNGEFLDHHTFKGLCWNYDIPIVDELHMGRWSKEKQESYLKDKIGDTNIWHEGVVIKSIDGNKRKRAKCISSEYLIYCEKNNIPDFH